jgi:hypothetical protein
VGATGIALIVLSPGPVRAQQTPPPPSLPPATPPTDDIVVTGLRDIDLDDPKAFVTHRTLGSSRTGTSAIASRSTFAVSERFARCAIDRDAGSRDMLRKTLDGAINGAGQRFWQGRFIGMKATCAQDPQFAAIYGIASGTGPGYDPSYYDRGAMFVRAIRMFAPDLSLTRTQTADPAVQQRFDVREIPLARYRLPVDRTYFETAVCLVRLQPELSVRLVRTQRTELIPRLEAAIVDRAPVCVGGARKVYFDPSQFRFYIADALYRWMVAARGVDTLVPS